MNAAAILEMANFIQQCATSAVTDAGAGTDTETAIRLNEVEVYGLLDRLSIGHAPFCYLPRVASAEQRRDWAAAALQLADDRGRLLLKVVGRELLHKSDIGGVRVLSLAGSEAPEEILLEAAEGLGSAIAAAGHGEAGEGIMAAAFVPHEPNLPGQELLLSVRLDHAFGPAVVIAVGGTLTEWYGRGSGGRSQLILPAAVLAELDLPALLQSHPLLSLLCQPSRLYPEAPLAVETIAEAVSALGAFAMSFGPTADTEWTVAELELNPIVASQGRLVALDGVGLLSRQKWTPVQRPLEKIESLLQPSSAVVLGVSSRGVNPGRIILDNLRRSPGIANDRLYVVHHKEEEIDGITCYKTVSDLPESCDLAVVAVPAEGALHAIEDLVAAEGAASIILIPGGFAETGQTGLAASIEAVLAEGHAAPGGGPVMVGGNCLGIVSRDQYNTFFLPEYKLPFRAGRGENLAMVSQSGAYLVTFASNYDGIIQPRASISFGNQMDLSCADFLQHFIADERVDVMAFYVEGFQEGDGGRFVAAAAEARRCGKRVLVFKAGKTARGAQAAASHTASLAGDYAVAAACLRAVGVVVAETLDEFEDLIKTFTLLAGKTARGDRVGIISNAGFECSTVVDQLGTLRLATFDTATRKLLDEVLPGYAHRDNPIDCTPMTGTDAFARSAEAILASSEVDLAVISSVPVTPALDNLEPDPLGGHGENIYADRSQPKRLIEIMTASAKPAVVVIDSGRIYDAAAVMIERAGIPVFRKIDRAARALTAFYASAGPEVSD